MANRILTFYGCIIISCYTAPPCRFAGEIDSAAGNVMFPESLPHDVDEYRGKHGMKRSELLALAAEQYRSSSH